MKWGPFHAARDATQQSFTHIPRSYGTQNDKGHEMILYHLNKAIGKVQTGKSSNLLQKLRRGNISSDPCRNVEMWTFMEFPRTL